ncbi:chromosomal replication initiator protein DnaA [bacterium]|nr:chromosomal replication initiator protein DnaA [bacterium]
MQEQLAEQLSRPKYELLIRPLKAVSMNGDTLVLSISNEVLRGWLLDQYGELLTELASLVADSQLTLQVVVDGSGTRQLELAGSTEEDGAQTNPADPAQLDGAHLELLPSRGLHSEAPRSDNLRRPLLNPRYTFDSFVVGPNNQFCYSACWQVAKQPGRTYNPLFIYSGVGLGKTHLMHSIGHAVWNRDHGAQVVYVTSEKFTNDFIEHVRTGRMPQFHARYRQADILLIDDIQFLSGKQETQIEFFHTFMHLVEAGKQIVISSDRQPRTLKGIEDRLVSRFAHGLVCDISDPSLETRIAILQQKAQLEKVDLPSAVCNFIAERVSSNVRELEGALIRLLAFCDINHSAPTVDIAARVLADYIDTAGVRPQLNIQQIITVVSEYFNVSEKLLLSPNRSKRVATARMVVMYMAREYTNLTLAQIGEELGGRDHSTVSHGANKISQEVLDDPYIEQAVTQISRLLK